MKTLLTRNALFHRLLVITYWWRSCFVFFSLLISFTAATFAQNKIWDKTIGSNGYDQLISAQQTKDGGYILGGTSNSPKSGDKSESKNGYWIVKLKADGSKEWDKTFGSSRSFFHLADLQQTQDGGYILGGYTNFGKEGDKSEAGRGDFDYWVVKVKADGSKEWDKTLGGNSLEELTSVQQTQDGGYIVGGSSSSGISGDKTQASKGAADYWVVKLTADGQKAWDKLFGGEDYDKLTTIQQTSDEGYILGGSSSSDISGDKTEAEIGNHNANDFWVIKLNAQGSKVWDKTIGGDWEDELNSLQQTRDGGYILGGTSGSNKSGDKTEPFKGFTQGIPDYWVVKIKADGTKEWDNTLGGDRYEELTSVQQTQDGGYILGGSSPSGVGGDKTEPSLDENDPMWPDEFMDYWIVKLNADGTKTWDKTIGGLHNDRLASIQQISNGSYILGGSSTSDKGADKSQIQLGGGDYWVVNLDNSGTNLSQFITFEPVLDKIFGEPSFTLSAEASSGLPVTFSVVSGPATVKDSIVTLTGLGKVTIKASQAGNAAFKSTEATQSFLVQAPPTIQKQWDKTLGGDQVDNLTALVATPDGGYLLGGTSLSGQSGDKSMAGNGKEDYWLVKTDKTGKKEWDKSFGGSNDDKLTALIASSDGGYLLGGYSTSPASGDKTQGNKGAADYWVVKINATGTKLWDKTYGGGEADQLTVLLASPGGGYLLGGSSASGASGDKSQASQGGQDYWLIQINSTGVKLWDKTYGGSNSDKLAALISNNAGGYLLGGSSASGISGDKSQATRAFEDYWIVSINGVGDKEWDKTFGGVKDAYTLDACGPDTPDCNVYFGQSILSALITTPDGGFLLGGSSNAEKGADKSDENQKLATDTEGFDAYLRDYWLVKIDKNGNKLWDKTYGGIRKELPTGEGDASVNFIGDSQLKYISSTPEGDYVLAGTSNSDKGNDKSENSRATDKYSTFRYDYWLVRIDSNGDRKWDKTIGGVSNDYLAVALSGTDNNYILGGTSRSGKGADKSEPYRDASEYQEYRGDYWLVNLQVNNNSALTAWDMRYGGSGKDNFTSAIKTSDGGYLSGGYTYSRRSGDITQSSQGNNDYWIVKSDKNGQKLWDKRYGSAGNDYLNRVIQTSDGGYLLGGSSLSGKSGDKTEASQGERDYWVVKVDAFGNKQWDKTFGGAGQDELEKVVQLATGEYVLGGSSNSPVSGDKTQSSQGGYDFWVVKISRTGVKLWDKRYGGSQAEILGSFIPTKDGGFFLGGSSLSGQGGDKSQANQGDLDYWAVKTDKDGNLLWDKTLGGSGADQVHSVGRSNGDTFYLAGTSNSGKQGDKSQTSQGENDYWLVKLDATGNKLWDKRFGGSQHDILRASTYTDEGHYILAGYSYSGVSGDKSQPSQGTSDYWVIEVDKAGEKVQDQRYGGSGEEELRTVLQTNDGGLLLGGRSTSGISGERTQPSQGTTDYWLVKVARDTSPMVAARIASIFEPGNKAELRLLQAYPNPFKEQVQVSFTLPETQMATMKVYDNQGQEIATLFQQEARANQVYQLKWQPKYQAAGLYFLRLQTKEKVHHQKVLLTK